MISDLQAVESSLRMREPTKERTKPVQSSQFVDQSGILPQTIPSSHTQTYQSPECLVYKSVSNRSIDDYLVKAFTISLPKQNLVQPFNVGSQPQLHLIISKTDSQVINKAQSYASMSSEMQSSTSKKQSQETSTKNNSQQKNQNLSEKVQFKGHQTKIWSTVQLDISAEEIRFGNKSFEIKNISAIKILPQQISRSNEKNRMIQVHFKVKNALQEVSFYANCEKHKNRMTAHFEIFSRILEQILKSMNITKMSKSWKKTPHLLSVATLNTYIFGTIYKKSQMRGKWAQRYVTVAESGIFSYQSASDKNHTFFIPANSIKHMETRFQFVYEFLVVKIKHGFTSTEFGIPIVQFGSTSCNNWLLQFYRVINKKM